MFSWAAQWFTGPAEEPHAWSGGKMSSAEYDLRYLKAGVDMLEDYIQSSELYWSIGISARQGQTPYPQMTLGGLLLFFQQAGARNLTPEQQVELSGLESKLNTIRSHWRTAWGVKATHAFRARLKLWSNFLEDYRQKPEANKDRYRYEVTRRVQLHLLQPDADGRYEAEENLLVGLDEFLKVVFITNSFLWDPELANGFPPDPYWYLYGRLKD
jgi:hypothetical protein